MNKFDSELRKDTFRVTIFGSARIKPNDRLYKNVFELAKEIGKHEIDVVTGGGPGLMDAANAGHEAGDPKNKSESIGLPIKLPWENKGNNHLEIKKQFNKFSNRLDNFMALSKAIIITDGGVGTCLELFYAWQLVQVKHIHPIPIILIGPMWKHLIEWVKKYQVKHGLVSPSELQPIHIAKNNKEAMKIVLKEYKKFKKEGKDYYKKFKKYKAE